MKKIICITLVSGICLTLNGCSNNDIASVNGIKISNKEYEKVVSILNATNNYTNKKLSKEAKNDIKDIVKSYIIDNEVVYQEGKLNGLEPTNEELDIKFKELKKAINSNVYYKSEIEKANIDDEDIKSLLRKDMTIEKYKEKYKLTITISDNEIKNYYNKNKEDFEVEEIRVKQILISVFDENNNRVSEEEKNALNEKAIAILNEIKQGEEFEELAKKYSDDKVSGRIGGDLGFFTKDSKNIEFTNQVFDLKENEDLNIIETSYGYHIVKVVEKKKVSKSYEECENEIKEKILNNNYIEHVKELNKNSKIKM